MHVEEVDARTASDAVLDRFVAIELACHGELAPGEPPLSAEETIAFHRHQPTTHTSCHWLADGGTAALYVHGPAAAFVHLLVDPECRRRGIGTGLLAACFGAVDGQRIVRSLLQLRTAEFPEARVPDGWRLATWLGRVPDEHLDAYVRSRAAMDDAPAPEEMEFPTWTAETVRASEESLARREREMRLTVALDPHGEVGAFTELRVSRGSVNGFTDDTATAAAHRGKGLARAVKLESLRRLRGDHPEVEVVSTSNAEENATMRHINGSIGFRATATETMATLRP